LATAGNDAFWQDFDRDPLAAMEFLENKVAPLALNAEMLFFRYLGTDPVRFAKAFELFEIVDGQAIPPGQRGFLFNKLNYEDAVKHKIARRLDKMKDRLEDGKTIADDTDLQAWVKLNKVQYKEITFQLDDRATKQVRESLQKHLSSTEVALEKLLPLFFEVTDANFATRYKLFYDVVAPHLMLYAVKIGDTMTVKGFTAAGYPTSANVKVYGTFRFKSLDKSALAGSLHMMDLMTYRDLYGYLSADKKAEIELLQKASGVKEIKREDAEAELFGGGGEEVVDAGAATPTDVAVAASPVDEAAAATQVAAHGPSKPAGGLGERASNATKLYRDELNKRVYTQQQIDTGVVRNIAIILKKGVNQRAAAASIQALLDKEKLGLQVVDWRTASGAIGNFLWVIYSVLAAALGVIFIVAIIVMNNSMVMATLERTREIGTMRAIGAQKSLIVQMFMAEAVTMALVFGAFGAGLAGIIIAVFNHIGLPAWNDVTIVLFAGPRLYPTVGLHHMLIAGVLVSLVTLFSTLYPAWLAMRVTPLQAMQDAE
jgi:ABC-type antimicrobial peptide transport system permease subunit